VSFRSILAALPGAKHLQVLSPQRQGPQITNFEEELLFKGDLEILQEEVYMLVLLAFFKRNVTLCGA